MGEADNFMYYVKPYSRNCCEFQTFWAHGLLVENIELKKKEETVSYLEYNCFENHGSEVFLYMLLKY